MDKSVAKTPPPQLGEGKRGEAGYLGYLLRQAAAGYRLRFERAVADLGVTPPQFSVLTMLAAYPGQSNADLARLALLTPQTVSVILANLEKSGAIARRPHETHGRIMQVALTPRGEALLARCRAHAQAIERELAAGLSEEEERLLRRWLVRVATAAQVVGGRDDPA